MEFNNWERHNENRIVIYTSDSTNELTKYGAKFYINNSLENTLSLLKNIDNYNTWINGMDTAKIEKVIDNSVFTYRFYLSFFGGIIKRDAIAKVHFQNISKSEVAWIVMLDKMSYPEEELDELSYFRIKWHIRAVDHNRIQLCYEGLFENNFFIPRFLMRDSLLTTFENMIMQLSANNAN